MPNQFTKGVDQQHKVTLDSILISAEWRTGVAYGDQSASFVVRTSMVGRGAPVKCKGTSVDGLDLGTVTGTMRANQFVGSFEIPAEIELGDHVSFEVELPKNGLSGASNVIPACPPVVVENLSWGQTEARRGDVLELTADVRNAQDETEAQIKIYEYDQDAVHDRIAEIPALVKKGKINLKWEYQYFEDTDDIPTEEDLQRYGRSYNPPEYFFTVTIGEKEFGLEQESSLLKFKDWFEIRLANPTGNERYTLTLADGSTRQGSFDEQGYAKEEDIPPGRVTLEIEGGE